MPIRRVGMQSLPTHPDLIARLLEELRNPKEADDAVPDDPFIIEETIGKLPLKHVMVVWDKWQSLGPEERGAVIMDAYEQLDPDDAKNISLSIGLTRREALKLGVDLP